MNSVHDLLVNRTPGVRPAAHLDLALVDGNEIGCRPRQTRAQRLGAWPYPAHGGRGPQSVSLSFSRSF